MGDGEEIKIRTDTEQAWDSAPACVSSSSSSQCCNLCASKGAKSSWSAEQPSSGVVSAQLGAKGAEELISRRQITNSLLLHKSLFCGQCFQGWCHLGCLDSSDTVRFRMSCSSAPLSAESPAPFSILVPPFSSATFS